MIQIDFTNEEEMHLKEEVQKRITQLDEEIAHTDSLNFKDMLKHRRASVQKFLDKLPTVAARK